MSSIDRGQKSLKLSLMCLTIGLSACAGSPPENLGIQDNKLAPCPSSPNCVSSYETSADHKVSPWSYKGNSADAQNKLLSILKSKDNVKVVSEQNGYVRAEFESSLMGFVDDVEFVITNAEVHMRSASRLGYSDLGANKKRIDGLAAEFNPCCE
ncbi:MAG: DUF1499 domain-containing protein [Pseudomonadales bacterium]|nr:DUF1499 domain-containing protein [Pseudomonadales bacterium]